MIYSTSEAYREYMFGTAKELTDQDKQTLKEIEDKDLTKSDGTETKIKNWKQ